jgi:hypothetical protein
MPGMLQPPRVKGKDRSGMTVMHSAQDRR